MIERVFYFLWLFSFANIGISQSSILDKYIDEGLSNNLRLKSVDLDVKIQHSAAEQAKKLWSPNLDFDASYLRAAGGRTIIFPIGDLFNPTYSTLNQLTGTDQFPTDLENYETQLTPDDFFDIQFNAVKPLINSAIKYNHKIQNELLALKSMNRQKHEQEVILQIKTAYYNYLKSFESIATIDESIKALNELLKFNATLVKYNKATKDVLSDVEYRIVNLSSQQTGIMEQQTFAKSLFNLLLNRDLSEDIKIDRSIIRSYDEISREILEMTEEAILNRTEVSQLQIAEKINELNKIRIKKERNPNVGIFAGIGVQAERNTFNEGGLLYTAGLSVSMKVYDGGLRQKQIEQLNHEKEQIKNDRAQLDQQIELEITQLYYQIKTNESQITSQLSAIASAEQSYKILKTKYVNNKILLIELLQAQGRLTISKIGLDLLKYDHLIKLAELDKALAVKS